MKWFSINGILTEMKRIRWPKGKDLAKDSADGHRIYSCFKDCFSSYVRLHHPAF